MGEAASVCNDRGGTFILVPRKAASTSRPLIGRWDWLSEGGHLPHLGGAFKFECRGVQPGNICTHRQFICDGTHK